MAWRSVALTYGGGSIEGMRDVGVAEGQLGLFPEPTRLFACTPSRLGAFEDCPRRYRFTYVDRPTPAKGPPWAHNSLGASVHSALRGWFDLPHSRRSPSAVDSLLRATWVREGYRDEEQERQAYGRARQWLRTYLDRLEPTFEPLGVERTVAARTATLALSGRADRIDDVDGQLVIVDYKTGRTGLGTDDARSSRALALYAFAAARVFRRPCRRVELHHLPTGTVAAHEHTDESLARHLRRAEETATDAMVAVKAVKAGADPDAAFPAKPGAICGWCDFRRSCPVGATRQGNDPWAGLDRGQEPAID
jgi:RecB family exonuclease